MRPTRCIWTKARWPGSRPHEIHVLDMEKHLAQVITGLQRERFVQIAGADGRPLGVHENAHGPVEPAGQIAHRGDHAPCLVVAGVGHVDAHHVNPGPQNGLQPVRLLGGRPDGGDDLGRTGTLHAPAMGPASVR